jgi:hypothetical protein
VLRKVLSGSFLLLMAACTSTTTAGGKTRSDLGSRLPAIHTAALVSVDVKGFEVSAGGTVERKEGWSEGARESLVLALTEGFKSRRIELRQIEPQPDTAEEINDLKLLSEAVNASLGFGGREFDYSLGPVGDLLDRYHVDALVFVWARGKLVTGARRFLVGDADAGLVAITLVDRSGDVLWHNAGALHGEKADLRHAESTASLLRAMIGELPLAKP